MKPLVKEAHNHEPWQSGGSSSVRDRDDGDNEGSITAVREGEEKEGVAALCFDRREGEERRDLVQRLERSSNDLGSAVEDSGHDWIQDRR